MAVVVVVMVVVVVVAVVTVLVVSGFYPPKSRVKIGLIPPFLKLLLPLTSTS